MSDDQDGCEWVSFFWYRPPQVDQRPLNGCVCVSLYDHTARQRKPCFIWSSVYISRHDIPNYASQNECLRLFSISLARRINSGTSFAVGENTELGSSCLRITCLSGTNGDTGTLVLLSDVFFCSGGGSTCLSCRRRRTNSGTGAGISGPTDFLTLRSVNRFTAKTYRRHCK